MHIAATPLLVSSLGSHPTHFSSLSFFSFFSLNKICTIAILNLGLDILSG